MPALPSRRSLQRRTKSARGGKPDTRQRLSQRNSLECRVAVRMPWRFFRAANPAGAWRLTAAVAETDKETETIGSPSRSDGAVQATGSLSVSDRGMCNVRHRISRWVSHLAKALPIRRQHEALLASDAGLDPEAHLFQLGRDFQAEAAFAGVDKDGNGRAGAEEGRDPGECRLDRGQRILPRDQADHVLPPGNAACRGGRHAGQSTPP